MKSEYARCRKLHIYMEDEQECEMIMSKLSDAKLILDTNDTVHHWQYDITALGEILIDFTAQGCNEEGQMLYARNAGGAPANVAVAAAKLGAHTAFIGKVGKDIHGEFLQETLKNEKVDTKGLLLDARYFTTLAFVNINQAGERTFSFARKSGADTKIQREEVDAALLDNARIFHVGSLSLTDEPARDATFYAVERAKNSGSLISYDPNYRASLWEDEQTAKKHMRSMLPYVDLMKISEEEIVLLTDCSDVQEAAKALYAQGISVVAVTLGGKGAYVYSKAGGRMAAGFPVKHIADTTGAGDSFWGGFLYKICTAEKSFEELTIDELAAYARFGNAVASLCVEKKGAIPAMPSLFQVEERMKNSRPADSARSHP
ncbi:MAG: carbohydrate kinase [Butyricicoccus pullicaecorum]|nr:carbohydrate kinase [Butyricicoccus pullicaecorum]